MYSKDQIMKAADQLKSDLENQFCDGDGRFLIDDVVTDILSILSESEEAEEKMSEQFIVGDKVRPKGEPTKDNLTYGYIRAITIGESGFYEGKELAWVYWPELKSGGRWELDRLTKC